MDITICNQSYKLDSIEKKVENLLEILFLIKKAKNRSIAFRSGCKSGICGSCAVMVNGVETLACKTFVKDGDDIKPLKYGQQIKDLIVDFSNHKQKIKTNKLYLQDISQIDMSQDDEHKISKQTQCILCNSCVSSCPVYEINSSFTPPFIYVRTFRYTEDKKANNTIQDEKIKNIQQDGIWDCTLCGNCTQVCPSLIDIKSNIIYLRNKSAQFGYNDPNMYSDNISFGFDPNGF